MSSTTPTLAGFQNFIVSYMGISTVYLPSDSPVIAWCLSIALTIVNPDLALVGNASPSAGLPATNLYTVAVYNLAGDLVVNFAQDQTGQSYLEQLRATLGVNSFQPGVVSSSSDASTATSLMNVESMKGLTLANLQNLKTPWGRMYLSIAQLAGPTIWGLS